VKIVHISDLHFGEHNESLQTDLLNRVRIIQPDLILCTGDVVDNTHAELFEKANEYLRDLEAACAGKNSVEPSLIVVPGNHDYFKKGVIWRDRKDRFGTYFGDDQADFYFARHGVWIFGFDSASEGFTGGGGRIRDEDLKRFHDRYLALKSEAGFDGAFKIVAVHHHPLPVNWDSDWKQRWLTMTNAGAFRSAALLRRVDLVLHGHEHLQARSHLRSTLGGEDGFQLTVLSLGATLRRVENPQRNWFSVVKVAGPSVSVDFFPSVGAAFAAVPENYVIRSAAQGAAGSYFTSRNEAGYGIERVVSYSILTADGDAKRIVECENLTLSGEKDPLETGLPIKIPFTCGYVDKLKIVKSNLSFSALPENLQPREFETTLTRQAASQGDDFAYSWYVVNSFAMDTGQFALQYSQKEIKGSDKTEFTYFPVRDPIEELTLVVQFPQGFRALELIPRVAWTAADQPPRQWKAAQELEAELRESKALRVYDAMNAASLRVQHPRIGASYGIQWRVPRAPERTGKQTKTERQIQELRKRWAQHSPTRENRESVLLLLARLVNAARVDLMDGWSVKVEASFLFLDHSTRSLACVAAGMVGEQTQEIDYGEYSMPFGMGIAGRAFKANRVRIYAPADIGDSEEPDYYYLVPGRPPHTVLGCIPVQNPEKPEYGPYGVLCLGSDRADCPLAYFGEAASGTNYEERLEKFQQALNREILDGFIQIYLSSKADQAGAAGKGGLTSA
jgi:3',5'-cyclic AMP phosphodiesterase CpdA